MTDRVLRAPRRYETSLDRAGLALGVGSVLGGGVVLALFYAGGMREPMALAIAWIAGSLFVGLGITAVAGPLWLVLHVAGLRRARHAALVGALSVMAVFVGAQTWGFGLFTMPAMDSRTLLMRWVSAVATSGILAVAAAFISLVMWRIAYRRER